MVLSISQALLFWVTLEFSFIFIFFYFFSWCKMSCGQGVEPLPKGRGYKGGDLFFWFWFSVRPKAPWCSYDRTWIKMFVHPQLFFFWVLIYLTKCLVEQSQWNHLRINPIFSVAVPSRIINSFGPVCIQGLTPPPHTHTNTKTTLSGSCFT